MGGPALPCRTAPFRGFGPPDRESRPLRLNVHAVLQALSWDARHTPVGPYGALGTLNGHPVAAWDDAV